MNLVRVRSLLGPAILCLVTRVPAQPRYTVEVLSPLPSGSFSKAFDINELGDIAGSANDAVSQRAIIWKPNPIAIPEIPGDVAAEARAINCQGEVVGTTWLPSGHSRPLFWDGHLSPVYLELGNEIDGVGADLNEAGAVVGTFGAHAPFLFANGNMIQLNSLFPPNGPASASGINETGSIIGSSINSQGTGWIWTRWESLIPIEGSVLPGGTNSWGNKINCHNHSTGTSHTLLGFRAHLQVGTSIVDCGTIPAATDVFGYGLNDHDVVVGAAQTPSGLEAFIWEGVLMERLTDLIVPGPAPVQIQAANAINNRGEIACEAMVDGEPRGVILHPVSTITGQIHLVDGDGIDQSALPPLNLEVWDDSLQVRLRKLIARTSTAGEFSIPLSLPAGTYAIKAWRGTFLRKVLRSTPFGQTGSTGLEFSLANGDVNMDNAVDLGDFDLLATSFGLVVGDTLFIPTADLNQDGVCDLGDFDILARHFGEEGD